MKKLCIYFKKEVSGALIDLGDYDGVCMRRRKNRLVKKKECVGNKRCRSYESQLYKSPE